MWSFHIVPLFPIVDDRCCTPPSDDRDCCCCDVSSPLRLRHAPPSHPNLRSTAAVDVGNLAWQANKPQKSINYTSKLSLPVGDPQMQKASARDSSAKHSFLAPERFKPSWSTRALFTELLADIFCECTCIRSSFLLPIRGCKKTWHATKPQAPQITNVEATKEKFIRVIKSLKHERHQPELE